MLGLEGNNGKAAPFFGVNGDVLQVSVEKLPWVCMGVGRVDLNYSLDACIN